MRIGRVCGDMYGAHYDLLAAALSGRADRLRAIVARWRSARHVQTARLGPDPAWCSLTRAGLASTTKISVGARHQAGRQLALS